VSSWTGDGNANDLTGGNNGTLQGSASFASGQVGQAFNFDGSSGYVSAGNTASLRLTQAITIEAWINPRSGPSGNNLTAIVTKWAQIFSDTPDSDSYGLWLGQSNGVVNLFSAIHQAGGLEPHVQGGAIPLNAWTHVAMTFESASGQYVAYINGQPVASLTSPGAIITTSRNVFIGREDSYLPRQFNGLIDEVAIFNRALSASEIQAIFSAGSAGKCKTGGAGTGGPGPGPVGPTPGSVCDSAFSLSLDSGKTQLAAVDFGSASVSKKETKTLYVQVFSKGTGLMVTSITGVTLPFSLADPTYTSFGVGGGSWQGFNMHFTPTAVGPQNAKMVITTTDAAFPTSKCEVPLAGTGIP
jgi:hypothetical protein